MVKSSLTFQRCYICGVEIACCYWFYPSVEKGIIEGPLCSTCCSIKNYASNNLPTLEKILEKHKFECDEVCLPAGLAEELRPGILDQLNKANKINPLYKNKYDILYLDPPWHYNDKASAGKRGAVYNYQVMTDGEIVNLPVGDLAKENSYLFLWATCPKLDIALSVMSNWGFTYKTVAFVWVKTTKNNKLFWGMGNWSRANSELCLLGVKGKPKRAAKNVHQIIMSQRREHSRKPDEARDKIVALCGKDSTRLEMFARGKLPEGWDGWGFEYENSLNLFLEE